MTVGAIVDEVQRHLKGVYDIPSKDLDTRLLGSCNGQVLGKHSLAHWWIPHAHRHLAAIQQHERDALLNQLSALLPTLQQDPTPATDLIQNLITTAGTFPFSRVQSIQPPVNFIAGLTSNLPPINLTVLTLLETARYNASDIGIIAMDPVLVGTLVRLWLCTPDTAVGMRAHEVLSTLLINDVSKSPSMGRAVFEECLLWRRIFQDQDIYGSIFSLCSLSTVGQAGQPTKREKTVAQARLLHMVLCIDSEPLRKSQIRKVEEKYNVKEGVGLLHFAATSMVEYQDDVLMHTTLIDFYAKYLGGQDAELSSLVSSKADFEGSSSHALRFLQEFGIHERTMGYFLKPENHDALDLTYLYGSSAAYVATYCSTYSQNLLEHLETLDLVLTRLSDVLHSVSPGQWSTGQVPKHDLSVLASLPRIALLPRGGISPLFLLPPKSASPSAFNTLAYIFHGRSDALHGVHTAPENPAARALYFLYMERFPSFWTHVITAAETIAIKEVALAAISFIGAIINAQWAPLPDTSPSEPSQMSLPSERALMEQCHTHEVQLPRSGIETIMSEPAMSVVIPYLMKPAQTFSNLVGGGRGDVESSAYKVAVAKHDVLVSLHQRLQQWVGTHSEAQEMVATVGRRVAQGPMGGASDVGGRIGTLDL